MRIHQKRFLIIFIILLILSLLAVFYYFNQYQNPRNVISSIIQKAQAQEITEEFISDFQVDVKINTNNTVEVTETIVYNFGDLEQHGIYREIPYSYLAKGGKFNVRLDVLGVFDENGQTLSYEVSKQSGNVKIKIGDPDVLVTGFKTYKISYAMRRVINFFEDHDEFYWNVTGNNWQVPIDRSGIVVRLPKGISVETLQAECFTGPLRPASTAKRGEQVDDEAREAGSTQKDCQVTNLTESQVGYTSFNILSPYEGLTVVLGWPKGVLSPPNFLTQVGWILKDNPLILLPLLVLLVMVLLWYLHGRDLGKKRSIIPYYEVPRGLTPVEVGSLIDERVNLQDISATFIYLAVKGYIKIKKLDKKDWGLIKLKDFNGLKPWGQDFANDIFGSKQSIKISELKHKFYKYLPKLKQGLYKALVEMKFFPVSPSKVRNIYIIVAILLLFGGVFVLPLFQGGFNFIALIIAGITVFLIGQVMPYKTKEGTLAYQEIKGYKMYLEVAEKDRINFHNAPEKSPEVFEKNLPYAMALGVEKKWAKQFESIYVNQPSWYEGNFTAFNSLALVNSLNSFNSYSKSTITSQASSGGSGFSGGGSGGGFGGGGGGSW